MAEYGSSDAGASLGDILGAALKSKEDEAADEKASKKDSTEGVDAVVSEKTVETVSIETEEKN